ncbi:MAG: aldo/keto reductase, partial [Bifidobacterium boum]|nr:aldo/keto reductase [Bifidobacterium boum]
HDAIVALNTIAAARGQSLADMALAWLLRKSEVTSVLVGASRPEQLLDSIGALHGPDFTDDELSAIDQIARDGR